MKSTIRIFLLFTVWAGMVASALAGTLTIKSPTAGSYLGRSSSLRIGIAGARVEVTVKVALTLPGGGVTNIEQRYTPNALGEVDASIPLNFGDSSPEGSYLATVTATEPNATYTAKSVTFLVDVTAPKLASVSPVAGAYVKGIVKIRAKIDDANIRSWEVRVNDQLIPNNTGTTPDVAVDWDSSSVDTDGPRTINLTVEDSAGNKTMRNIAINVDRIKPSLLLVYPRSETVLISGSTITVLLDVTDATAGSVDATGIDVLIRATDGTLLGRVARLSVKASGSNVLRWTGRIRSGTRLPRSFRIVGTAVDRAGNVGTPQEILITLR